MWIWATTEDSPDWNGKENYSGLTGRLLGQHVFEGGGRVLWHNPTFSAQVQFTMARTCCGSAGRGWPSQLVDHHRDCGTEAEQGPATSGETQFTHGLQTGELAHELAN